MGIPKGEERENGIEFKEITADNISNIGEELDIPVYEASRTYNYLQCKKNFSNMHYIKTAKS